jgi:CBS domain-containing protein
MSEDEDEADSEEQPKIVIPMKAVDVMSKDVITLGGDVTAKRAAEIMAENGVNALVVTAQGKAIGILTERDILKRIVIEDRNSLETKVKDIMSSPLITIDPNVDLEKAAQIMFEKKIKNLPVLENGRLRGLLSLQDICKLQPEVLRILKQLMETPQNLHRVLSCYII